MTNLAELTINTIRFLAADAVQQANSGHPGMPMGAAPMAYTLWQHFLKHDPSQPNWFNRDRFVLSGGHGSALLYALLHLTGYDLPLSELRNFRQWGSKTPGHPESHLTPGVDVTTGPLGQGFANGVGLALAAAHLAARWNQPGLPPLIDHYVYGIVTDGDLMEGISAEAASLAGHWQLGKLIYLYDDNHISIEGSTDLAFSEDVAARFRAYGWQVLRVADGNDTIAIADAITEARANTIQPTLICIRTIIGYGAPNRQNTAKAHGEPLGASELQAAKQQLGWTASEPFYVPPAVAEHTLAACVNGAAAHQAWLAVCEQYQQAAPAVAADLARCLAGALPDAWEQALPTFAASTKGMATREASGRVLNALAGIMPELIGGSADLAPSTKTIIAGSPDCNAQNYAGRNLRFGVREHAMGAIVNGMAAHGLRPYAATFLAFYDYMRAAVRLAALCHLPAIWVYTHDSIGVGEDGPTHQPVEHLAALRAVPNLVTLRPADANETTEAWRIAIQRQNAPTALILTRQNLPILDRTQYAPASGVQRGGYVLSPAPDGNPQALLLATGSEVQIALQAQAELAAQGVSTNVISLPSWELFAQQDQTYREQVLPPQVTKRVAIEAGSSFGWERWVGLTAAQQGAGRIVAIDHFGASAPAEVLYAQFGLTAAAVVAAVLG